MWNLRYYGWTANLHLQLYYKKPPTQVFLPEIQPEACNFIKKETLAQVFSCEFCKISKKTIFKEHLRVTASELKTSGEVPF